MSRTAQNKPLLFVEKGVAKNCLRTYGNFLKKSESTLFFLNNFFRRLDFLPQTQKREKILPTPTGADGGRKRRRAARNSCQLVPSPSLPLSGRFGKFFLFPFLLAIKQHRPPAVAWAFRFPVFRRVLGWIVVLTVQGTGKSKRPPDLFQSAFRYAGGKGTAWRKGF